MRALTYVAVLCALVVAGCGSGGDEEAGAPPSTATTSDPPSRQPAPAIEGVSLEGERISVADVRGQPVLVNVWSSW